MKFKPDQRYDLIAAYTLSVIVIAMIVFHLLGHIGVITSFIGRIVGHLMPVILGVVIAFLLSPILKMFEGWLLPKAFSKNSIKPGIMRAMAILCTYLFTFVLIAAIIAIIIPDLINSGNDIWNQIPVYQRMLNDWYFNITAYIQQFSGGDEDVDIFAYFLADFAETLWAVGSLFMERAFELINELVVSLIAAATTIAASIINIVLGIVISIYILKDKKKILAQVNKVAIAIFPKRAYLLMYDVAQDTHRIFSGFVVGRIIDSIIVGALCAIGMMVLGMPHIVLVTVIIGITNFIPIFGPIIGAIPSAFIIFTVDPMMAAWFVLFILVLQQLEGNFIGPKIVGDIIGLPPLMIIASLILFAGLMGFLGMLIGVPLFAVMHSMAKRFVSFLLVKKGYPTETAKYLPENNPLLIEEGQSSNE